MAFLSPYCSVAYADTYNTSSEWIALSADEKSLNLSMGAMYINKYYTCADIADWDTETPDYTTIPDEVQLANAQLAELQTKGELLQESPYSGKITSKKVKAGSVETETEYQGARAQYYGKSFNELEGISLLLDGYCTFGANRTTVRV